MAKGSGQRLSEVSPGGPGPSGCSKLPGCPKWARILKSSGGPEGLENCGGSGVSSFEVLGFGVLVI